MEKQVQAGSLDQADMRDAEYRSSQAAILDQDTAGIDVITGGEMHRRTNNRNAPPNAMLNHFSWTLWATQAWGWPRNSRWCRPLPGTMSR